MQSLCERASFAIATTTFDFVVSAIEPNHSTQILVHILRTKSGQQPKTTLGARVRNLIVWRCGSASRTQRGRAVARGARPKPRDGRLCLHGHVGLRETDLLPLQAGS